MSLKKHARVALLLLQCDRVALFKGQDELVPRYILVFGKSMKLSTEKVFLRNLFLQKKLHIGVSICNIKIKSYMNPHIQTKIANLRCRLAIFV